MRFYYVMAVKLGLSRKSMEELAQIKRARSEKIAVVCTLVAKKKSLIKTGVLLHKYFRDKEYRCYDCSMAKKAQDKKEMNQALINLARSKGLIK
jgi:hypothetical protein